VRWVVTSFIKIDHFDYDRKIELELEYQATLTTQQRFEILLRLMRAKNEYLERNGLKKPFEIIKRDK